MQNKEKKWNEVEKILEEYIEDDDELREKLQELRINVESNKKICNVVEENENLKFEVDTLREEVNRLRK
jgi:regulator of replication initiation timing